MAGKRTTAPKPAVAGKGATQPAAAAPAEQQDALPAGTTQADASAPTDATGAAASAAASTEQPTASESPGTETGSNGQDAQPGDGTTSELEASAATPAKADEGSLDDGEVEGLWIVAIPEQGFRRLGHRFTREGFGIALSALTPEQVEILENEPNLKVERGMFSGLVE